MAESVSITLPDGAVRDVLAGTSAGDVLRHWRPNDARSYLAASLDGVPIDLARGLDRSGRLVPLTFDDPEGKEILHHSAAHLIAKAVVELRPDALPTVGPATPEGFHYDFDMPPLTPEDIPKIEVAVHATVKANPRFERQEVSKEEALRRVSKNKWKQSYVADVAEGESISFYRTGEFVDLCRGPHVPEAHWLRGIQILGFSGITAGGTPDGAPLQRIRGVAFPTVEQRDEYNRMRKEAEARDHRSLGQRLELFAFVEEAPGFPFWLPNGMIVVRELERYVTEHLQSAGYSEIRTPLLFARSVFETSGHWEHYRANMFLTELEGREFGWKPMNCPGSMLVFRSRARSYRELPLRLAEFAPLHRLEASGTLHGLTRVREFVQDDAHLFVTEEMIDAEIRTLLEWVRAAFATFRLNYSYELSTRPPQFLGEAAEWDRAEATLERLLKESGVPYRVAAGEGAFYGPKIDIHIKDSLGRPWQTGTIQLDYQIPQRFRLEYQGADGAMHTPIVIHRTILGTWERFLGVLLEHCNGRLPPWLAPIQMRVLPVTERHVPAAEALVKEFRADQVRVESTGSSDTLSKRVRQAELDRVPYVAVVGDQELSTGNVALRIRGEKGQLTLPVSEARSRIRERIRSRAFDP